MTDRENDSPHGFTRLIRWIGRAFVQEAPEELTHCQFRCNKTECPSDDWENCPLRLRESPAND